MRVFETSLSGFFALTPPSKLWWSSRIRNPSDQKNILIHCHRSLLLVSPSWMEDFHPKASSHLDTFNVGSWKHSLTLRLWSVQVWHIGTKDQALAFSQIFFASLCTSLHMVHWGFPMQPARQPASKSKLCSLLFGGCETKISKFCLYRAGFLYIDFKHMSPIFATVLKRLQHGFNAWKNQHKWTHHSQVSIHTGLSTQICRETPPPKASMTSIKLTWRYIIVYVMWSTPIYIYIHSIWIIIYTYLYTYTYIYILFKKKHRLPEQNSWAKAPSHCQAFQQLFHLSNPRHILQVLPLTAPVVVEQPVMDR